MIITPLQKSIQSVSLDGDFASIVLATKQILEAEGVSFRDCSIQLVDEKRETFDCWFYKREWDRVIRSKNLPAKDTAVWEAYRAQQVILRTDLLREDRYHEKPELYEASETEIRTVVDVPFPYGTVAINSEHPHDFDERTIEILTELTKPITEGYFVYADLHRLWDYEVQSRRLLECIPDVIYVLDARALRYTYINASIETILGYSRREIMAMDYIDFLNKLVHPADREKRLQILQQQGEFYGSEGIEAETRVLHSERCRRTY